jgi:non-ribosomal peptide synthetase component E (peptide arylation enzyme)
MPGVVYQSEDALQRYVEAGVLTNETLASALRAVAARYPEQTALSEPGWRCTHAEFDALTDRAAAGLLSTGLAPLDRVLFQVANSKETVIALVACWKAGLIPVCTLAAHRRHEISYLGRHSAARAHLVDGADPKFDFVAFSREMRGEIPSLAQTIVLRGAPSGDDDGFHAFDALIARNDLAAARRRLAEVELDPFQVVLFQLSGGTTGVPKIIPRFNNEYLYSIRTVLERHQLGSDTVAYTPNPLMHNAPMICYWGPGLFAGGEVMVAPSLDAAIIGPFMAERRPNWLGIPAPILLRLKEAGWLANVDGARIKGISVSNAAARTSALLGGAPAWGLFGMTEGLLSYCAAGDPPMAIDETVGRPLSPYDEVRILRPESDEDVAPGEIGELAVRGPCTIRGYYDAEERNRETFTRDGFYRSGDLMRFREIDGKQYLAFEGRLKDVVSRGGEKINCQEVERLAINHPDIGAIAIVPMPDEAYGERACAFVIPAQDAAPITVPELGAFLEREGVAKFKWPERIEIVEDFPMTSSGKLSKPKLKEQISAILREERDRARSLERAAAAQPAERRAP